MDRIREQPEGSEGALRGPLLNLDVEQLRQLGELFRLLGDRTRLSILQLLSAGETNVGALCDLLRLPQPTVSHHLSLLRVSGLIDNRRAGKQVYYRLNGRISPAALPTNAVMGLTKEGRQLVDNLSHHAVDATGMQITGSHFAVQIISSGDGSAFDAVQ